MAHYLLKKRIMMELQQQQQQEQQQHQQQQQEEQNQQNTECRETEHVGLRKPKQFFGSHEQPTKSDSPYQQTVTESSEQNSENHKLTSVTEVVCQWSNSSEILDLSTKTGKQPRQHQDQTIRVEEKAGFPPPSHDQLFADLGKHEVYYSEAGQQRTLTELDTLNENEEKQRLISKIVSIVRETVKVPIHNIDLSEKSVLHCMDILSNPLYEVNNFSMMQMEGCNQQQAGMLSMSHGASDMSSQLTRPSSSERIGPLISEGALWPVHNPEIAQLAVARPTPGKQLHDGAPSDTVTSVLAGEHQGGSTYCLDGYMPAMQSSSTAATAAAPTSSGFMTNSGRMPRMSAQDSTGSDIKTDCPKTTFAFSGELAREQQPGEKSNVGNANLLPVDMGSPNNLMSSQVEGGINVQKTNDSVYDSKEHDMHSFINRSPGGSGFCLVNSDKQDFSKSESFPEQPIYVQPPSFHSRQEGQLSPVTGSHQNSPASGPVCDSSSRDQELFEHFSRNEQSSPTFLPVTTSSAAPPFAQLEPCSLMDCPLDSSPARETPGDTQQNLISSSSTTASGSKTITSTKKKHASVDPSLSGYPVTSSGRNKGLGKTNEPKFDCQICGDLAAGFHCGAYVCEACKKFYLRCLKNDQNLLTCPKSQNCEINKENRSHCQYCRYQKCISLGMYRPGREDDKNLKVNFKAIPCKVCGASSSGFHFGAITCEGCKGFFRRMLKENLHQKFTCSSGNSCDITSSNRTFCKACRFNKCIKIGMTLEGTRLGRQSNSMKRTTLLAYKMREFDGPPAKLVSPGKIKLEPVDEGYRGESTSSSKVGQGVRDPDCSIVEGFDDVSLEVIDQLEFDNNLLGVSDSPRAKSSPQKAAQNSRSDGDALGDGADMSDQLTKSARFTDLPPDIPAPQCSQQPESLGVTWDGVFSVSESSNSLTVPDSSEQHSNKGSERRGHPYSAISGLHSGGIQNSSDDCQKDIDNRGNLIVNRQASQYSRTKQVGVEIYSDPERLTEYLVDIYNILDGMKEIPESMKQYKLEVGNPQNIWNFTMQGFVHNSYIMLRFLKSIPGFRSLPQDKQIKLCQETIYPISLLYHSQGYDLQQRKIKFFCYTDEVKELLFTSFPNFRGMTNHFEQCGRWMAEMKIDRIELAFLTVIFVLRATEQTIHDPAVVGYLETTTDILIKYCDKKDALRGGVLLARMAELERASFEHHQMAALTIKQNPHMSFGQLWQEIFIPD